MPMRRAVLATRAAISPRLAIRILANTGRTLFFLPRALFHRLLQPGGPALLEKGAHAFLALCGCPGGGDSGGHVVHQFGVDPPPRDRMDQVLGQRVRPGRALNELAQNRVHRCVQLRGLRELLHETDAIGFRRRKALGGEEIAVRGARPKRTSDTLNSVSTDATAMSQAAISPMPPANAAPCTRATVGFFIECRRLSMAPKTSASSRFSSKSSSPILFIQLRSAPAQNTLPRPASTTARTTGSRSSSPKAAESSAIIDSLKALRTSGRLSQMTATARPAWISMVWCVMPRPPE